jgi:competence protein ComEC
MDSYAGIPVLDASASGSRRLSRGHGNAFLRWCYRSRERARELLGRGIDQKTAHVAVLHALLLGYRGEIPHEIRDSFTATGTLHIFAISGLHVGIIVMLLIWALRLAGISRPHWVLFLAPALVVYTAMTGARASAVRACIMTIIYFLGPLLSRKPDPLSALALAAILILAVVPDQLFDVGFIFSFVIVTGLILLCPHFERPLRRLWQRDPLRTGGEPAWAGFLRAIGRYSCSLVALSCSAWLASAPLTAYFFHRVCPITLLANLFVVPTAFLIVVAGCLSLVFGSLLEALAVPLNLASAALITLLLRVIRGLQSVPFASLEVHDMPAWIMWGWYAALGAGAYTAGVKGGRGRAGQCMGDE